MATSARLQKVILKLLSDTEEHTVQEMKSYLVECGVDDYSEGQFSGSINTLLRNGSICKIDRGIYAKKKGRENMKKCFVVCPIGSADSDTRRNADQLLKHIIRPVCEECDFEAIRVDQDVDANSITQAIIDHLDNDELVIADLTEHNPNVFYEMGYRAKSMKPMIHLKRRDEAIPFDVNTIRTLEYDLTDIDSVVELKDRLKKTIESFSYSDIGNLNEDDASYEQPSSAVMPVLYQILDAIVDVKKDVKSISSDVISAVVTSIMSAQPKTNSDNTVLQLQLINEIMQNPENFMKLMEISEKINATKGKK